MWAQGGPPGQYFYQRDQAPQGGYGAPYADPSLVPQYSGMEQAGYPPGALAWPDISPYGARLDQHYMKDGFWFNRIVNGNSRYYVTAEGLITRTGAPPHALIGAEGVNVVFPDQANGTTGTTTDLGGFFQKTLVSGNGTPERDLTNTGSGNNTTGPVNIFPSLNAGVLKQWIGSGGFRGTWGWWNPEGDGFQIQGFWQDKGRSIFQESDLPIIINLNETNPSLPSNLLNVNYLTHLHPWFGLPLPGQDRDGDGLPGVVVPYDTYVRFDYTTSVYGGNLDWYFQPIIDHGFFKMRGLAGARILQVNEFFSFQGADSGMGYELEVNPNFTSNSNNSNSGNGNNSVTPPLNQLTIQTVDAQFNSPTPSVDNLQGMIFSLLQSRTQSTLAGPEVGARFDIGGERAKFWLQSKFGLLVNHSTRRLYGYNIGDHFDIITPTAPNPDNLPLDPQINGVSINPTRAAGIQGTTFATEKENTTVSPMFEQGIFFQAPIFSYIPLINRVPLFDKAEFQTGYTVLLLGGMYRPTNDIQWAQYPDLPYLTETKSKFYTTNWSVGVSWTY